MKVDNVAALGRVGIKSILHNLEESAQYIGSVEGLLEVERKYIRQGITKDIRKLEESLGGIQGFAEMQTALLRRCIADLRALCTSAEA